MLLIIILVLQIVLFALSLFSKSFVKGWVEGAIDEHFKKAAEKRQYTQQTRLKAELVAELMAEWVSAGADRKKLRELTNKSFLWLPKDIAMELSVLLSSKNTDIHIVDILSKVRAHLLGEEGGEIFDPNNIVSFDLTNYEKKIRKENDLKQRS